MAKCPDKKREKGDDWGDKKKRSSGKRAGREREREREREGGIRGWPRKKRLRLSLKKDKPEPKLGRRQKFMSRPLLTIPW